MTVAFEGFAAGGRTLAAPAQFFAELAPAIEDEAELRVTLHALYEIGRRGWSRPVRGSVIAASEALARSLEARGGAAAVAPALEAAAARGSLLACPLADGDVAWLLNNEAGRRAMERLRAGALAVDGERAAPPRTPRAAAAPAEAYEQEIGLLTPSISEALAAARARWPDEWVVEALREAARQGKRSWAYAEAILRRREREGAPASGGAPAPARDHGPYERVVRRSFDG